MVKVGLYTIEHRVTPARKPQDLMKLRFSNCLTTLNMYVSVYGYFNFAQCSAISLRVHSLYFQKRFIILNSASLTYSTIIFSPLSDNLSAYPNLKLLIGQFSNDELSIWHLSFFIVTVVKFLQFAKA